MVNLTDWKTKKQILNELREHGIKLPEREWRTYVEKYNKMYAACITDKYIVHSPKGYKLTQDTQEIHAALDDYEKRALNMLQKVSEGRKAVAEHMNMTFEEVNI
jgi:hypothetical protein